MNITTNFIIKRKDENSKSVLERSLYMTMTQYYKWVIFFDNDYKDIYQKVYKEGWFNTKW